MTGVPLHMTGPLGAPLTPATSGASKGTRIQVPPPTCLVQLRFRVDICPWAPISCGPPLQVLPDLAIQIGDVDEQAGQEFVAAATQRATAVIEHRELPADELKSLGTAKRIGGVQHMRAWDNGIQMLGMQGLAQFVVPPEHAAVPIEALPLLDSPDDRPPSLVMALDQGPQSYPTTFFLTYSLRLNMFTHFDTSHRLWNDCKDALAENGHWHFVVLSIIAMNLDYGPWDGSEFFGRASMTLKHFVANAGPDHPLFQAFAADIAKDSGADMSGDAASLAALFKTLDGHPAFSKKNPRVALSRWFGWFDSACELLKHFSTRHMVYIWLCVTHGYGRMSEHGWLLCDDPGNNKAKVGPAEASDSTPMVRSNESVDTMRSRCRNTLHLVTAWMCDMDNRRKLQVFTHLLRPLRSFHGSQNKDVRSCSSARDFFVSLAAGSGLQPLQEMASSLCSAGGLESCGFQVSFNFKALSRSGAECDVALELEWASMISDLALTLMRHRIMSCSHYMWSFPGAFVLCLGDASDQLDLLQWMSDVWFAWQGLLASPHASTRWWSKLIERSPMQHQMTRYFFRQGVEQFFLDFDAIQKRMAQDLTDGFCQTKLVEDAVHVASALEDHSNRNKKVPAKTVWNSIAHEGVMNQVHQYNEVQVPSCFRLTAQEKHTPLAPTLHEGRRRLSICVAALGFRARLRSLSRALRPWGGGDRKTTKLIRKWPPLEVGGVTPLPPTSDAQHSLAIRGGGIRHVASTPGLRLCSMMLARCRVVGSSLVVIVRPALCFNLPRLRAPRSPLLAPAVGSEPSRVTPVRS